jgi:hypothetical protein
VDGLQSGAVFTGTVIDINYWVHDSDGDFAGIRCNALAPGGTSNSSETFGEFDGEDYRQYVRTIPLTQSGIWFFWGEAWDGAQAMTDSFTQSSTFSLIVSLPPSPPSIVWENPPSTAYASQTFTVRARATDANGALSQIQMNLNGGTHRHADFSNGLTGSGSNAYLDSNTITAGMLGSSHLFTARALNASGLVSGTISHTVVVVNRAPDGVTLTLDNASIAYGQDVTISSTITDPDGNLQWHGLWVTAPGATPDHAKGAAWTSTVATGSASTISRGFTPSSAGTWQIYANGHDAIGTWGPGATKTLTVGKTTPQLRRYGSMALPPDTPLDAAVHLAAYAVNPHNPDVSAPSVAHTIIAGGYGSAPNGTVLAPPRVLPVGTYTVRISTQATSNYNATAQDVTFTVKSTMTPTERLHSNLGFDPNAATSADDGQLETEVYTPAR